MLEAGSNRESRRFGEEKILGKEIIDSLPFLFPTYLLQVSLVFLRGTSYGESVQCYKIPASDVSLVSAAREHRLTSEAGDSRTMPNPSTRFSPAEGGSAAWGPGCSEAPAVFFSISNTPGFCLTVRGSTVFGGTFFFLFLLRETAVRWEHIREIGGCCLFWVPTVENEQK